MASKFQCTRCGEDIIVSFLKIGEMAECKNCRAKNPVPESAQSIDDETAVREQSRTKNEAHREDILKQTEAGEGPGWVPAESWDPIASIPYAKAEGKGWEIVVTQSHLYFIQVYTFPWYQTLIYILTTPLWILPIIGGLVDLINLAIAAAFLSKSTQEAQKLLLSERYDHYPGSFRTPVSEIKSVALARKRILFETAEKSLTFYLLKPLKKVCPDCRSAMENLNIAVQ